MVGNAELEAAIAEDPEDPAAYLVYADWLATRGDPRGTLIALHDAERRGEPAPTPSVLDAHRDALLDGLAGHAVELDWFLGFLRGARVRADSLDAVRALLECRAAAFLRVLVIDERRHEREIVELLANRRAPATLTFLSIGPLASWNAPPHLQTVFPRLAANLADAWDRVLARVTDRRDTNVPHRLRASIDTGAVIAGLEAELDRHAPIGIAGLARQAFERYDADTLALAIASDGAVSRWKLDLVGLLGDHRCAEWIGEHVGGWPERTAMQAIRALGRMRCGMGLDELTHLLARVGSHRARRLAAAAVLDEIARSRGREGWMDLVAPRPWREDPRDDQLARWWLHELMVGGWRIPHDDFVNEVRPHVVDSMLVWGAFAGDELVSTFRLADAGPRDVDGAEVTIAAGLRVGVVHPMELEDDLFYRWVAHHADTARLQTILQIGRPVFELGPDEAREPVLTRFPRERAGVAAIADRLGDRDWYVHTRTDRGTLISLARDFARDRVTVIATLGTDTIAKLELADGRPFGALHPVTISELLFDVDVAHGRPEPAIALVRLA